MVQVSKSQEPRVELRVSHESRIPDQLERPNITKFLKNKIIVINEL